jgi:hypothetical protein
MADQFEAKDQLDRQRNDEEWLNRIPETVFNQYISLIEDAGVRINCSSRYHNQLIFSRCSLKEACIEIASDLRIILNRRRNLINRNQEGFPRMSRGKIAGITVFRLARTHIIHQSNDCIRCSDQKTSVCTIFEYNTVLALFCGFFFINRSYGSIDKKIRNELIYTLNKRHTNQETLGIVFDTIRINTP